MTDLEHNLAETFGPAAPFSDFKIGETVKYRVPGGQYSGVIIWVAAAHAPGISQNDELPLRYICQRSGWDPSSFPDVVYSSDILQSTGEEPTLEPCPYCGAHHYTGQTQYCPQNPNRPI